MSRKAVVALIAALMTGALVVVGLPVLLVMSMMSNSEEQTQSCGPQGTVVLAGSGLAEELSHEQLANAGTIVSEGYGLGLPRRAIIVALAVASQESGFLNYANDGEGDDLAPEQAAVGRSMELPHEAVGTDHGSLGIFQQQWPWWGSMPELMDPATASRKFYLRLQQVPGWTDMSIGEAGQAVQRSAYPDAYDDDVTLAVELLDSAASDPDDAPQVSTVSYFGGQSVAAACGPVASAGQVVYPLAESSSYVDQVSFGNAGEMWESTHTGTDFSAACGTPVRASTSGVVTVRTDQSWSGPWLVQVDSGQVVTWYAHMQSISVRSGQRVQAGQVIGRVGTEGNSSGCHLHFEVHPGGGEAVDPTTWLADNVGPGPEQVSFGNSTSGTETAVLVTANIPHWLSDAVAAQRIRQLLGRRPDVLMLQEMGPRNVPRMVARMPGAWGVYQPPGKKNRDVIVWNSNRFDVSRKGVVFGVRTGRYQAWMPWMLLESDSGTLPVVNIHLPTNSSKDPVMRTYYQRMTDRYLKLIRELSRAGFPPIVGGDWNHPLHAPREPWSPVPMLRRVGMTTNWQHGRPCLGTSANDGRIDGFAYNPDYLRVTRQGCLERGPSDHRPMWVEVAPSG